MPKRTQRRPVETEDLKRYKLVSDARISPDGAQILFTHKEVRERPEYLTNLWIVATDSAKGAGPRPLTQSGKDGQGRWSPDGRTIAFVSGRDKPKPQVYLLSLEGGEARALTRFDEGSIGEIRWSPDGTRLAVAFRATDPDFSEAARKRREESGGSPPARVIDGLWYRLDGDGYFNAQRFGLWIVDVATGEARLIFERKQALGFAFDWAPDSRELVIAANLDKSPFEKPWKDRLYRIDARRGTLRELKGQEDGARSAVAWSPDGSLIAYAGRLGRDNVWGDANAELWITDPDGKSPRSLTSGEDYCLMAATLADTREVAFQATLVWGADSRRVFTSIGWHGETHVASASIRGGALTLHGHGKGELTLGNLSADGKRLALLGGSATEPSEVHLGRLEGGELKLARLTRFNDALLGELALAKPSAHWAQAEDGAKVQYWVMRPPQAKGQKRLPAVLAVHGGPHAQYGLSYFHELQTLAAKGYVIYFGNPRGSKGYGEAHCAAIRGAWGDKDWLDVQAIAAAIEADPGVDPKRMAIMGGSYGGYMTNWAIARAPRRFKAAISDRCVSNLVSMSGNSDFPLVPDQYWKGGPWDRPEALWEQSPIAHFKHVKTPTLVIHSEGDLRCNVEQSEQVFSALKLLGVPTRLVRYPASTSHGMSRSGPPDLRIHRIEQMLAWFERYL